MCEVKPADAIIEGINLLESGDARGARTVLEEYTSNHRDNPDGFFYLGDALAEDGHIDKAIVAYREGLAIAPDDTDALTTLGDLLFESGQHEAAIVS